MSGALLGKVSAFAAWLFLLGLFCYDQDLTEAVLRDVKESLPKQFGRRLLSGSSPAEPKALPKAPQPAAPGSAQDHGAAVTPAQLMGAASTQMSAKSAQGTSQGKQADDEDAKVWANHTSIFCFVVATMDSEMEIVRWQFKKKFGIFACTHWAVYTSAGPEPMKLGTYDDGRVAFTKPIPGPGALFGLQTCAGCPKQKQLIENANVLMRAWERASEDGEAGKHAWVVKVDADTAFSPMRLIKQIKLHGAFDVPDQWPGRFFKNCAILDSMQGSLEVLSRQAFYNFLANKWKCYQQMDWYHMGEDIFTYHCLRFLGIWAIHLDQALHDYYCSFSGEPNCWVEGIAAFHPLKTMDEQGDCWWKMQQIDHKYDAKDASPKPATETESHPKL